MVLTTNSIACTVDSCDLRIQLYHHIALLCDLLVSGLNSPMYPGFEWLSYDSMYNIGDVLSRKLPNLLLRDRKCSKDIRVIASI